MLDRTRSLLRRSKAQTDRYSISGRVKEGGHAPRPITLAGQPLRKPREDTELGICTVCGKTWREADDCKTPQDCNFQRESR